MKKNLFKDNGYTTEEGDAISRGVRKFIAALYQEYIDVRGHDTADLTQIIRSSVASEIHKQKTQR